MSWSAVFMSGGPFSVSAAGVDGAVDADGAHGGDGGEVYAGHDGDEDAERRGGGGCLVGGRGGAEVGGVGVGGVAGDELVCGVHEWWSFLGFSSRSGRCRRR